MTVALRAAARAEAGLRDGAPGPGHGGVRGGDYSKAAEHCAAIVSYSPESFEGWFNLGLAYQKAGNHEKAARSTGARSGCSRRAQLYVNLGISRQELATGRGAGGVRAGPEDPAGLAHGAVEPGAGARKAAATGRRRDDLHEAACGQSGLGGCAVPHRLRAAATGRLQGSAQAFERVWRSGRAGRKRS